jgi:large subunit ribosomal protein L17
MRHGCRGRKFGRDKSQRRALLINLATALVTHETITTTLPRAKDLRPFVEKLLTKARQGGLHARRSLLAEFRHNEAPVDKMFDVLAPRFVHRAGGYLRIVKAGFRSGDRAPMALIQFVEQGAASV